MGRALVPPGSSSFSPKASGFGRDVRRMDSWYVFLFGIHRLTSLKEEDQWPNGHCPLHRPPFPSSLGLEPTLEEGKEDGEGKECKYVVAVTTTGISHLLSIAKG